MKKRQKKGSVVKVRIAKLIKMNQDQSLKKNYDANRAYCAPLLLLKSHKVLRAEKVKIYKTLARPVATYGAESWTLNADIAKRLAAFGRKVLRRMFGEINVNESWRR
jgi:hypothetical protein